MRLYTPIPLKPTRQEAHVAGQTFETIELTDDRLVQEITVSGHEPVTRHIDLNALSIDALRKMMTGLVRVPRPLEIRTLSKDSQDMSIRYSARQNALVSRLPWLPEAFLPEDIRPRANSRLSEAFGFDVKEALQASLAAHNAFPPDFWV